jgi:hypothetical protein
MTSLTVMTTGMTEVLLHNRCGIAKAMQGPRSLRTD